MIGYEIWDGNHCYRVRVETYGVGRGQHWRWVGERRLGMQDFHDYRSGWWTRDREKAYRRAAAWIASHTPAPPLPHEYISTPTPMRPFPGDQP